MRNTIDREAFNVRSEPKGGTEYRDRKHVNNTVEDDCGGVRPQGSVHWNKARGKENKERESIEDFGVACMM